MIVAIDRSTASKDVFETAVYLAKTTGASLMLLHVLSDQENDDSSSSIDLKREGNPLDSSILEAYDQHWQELERQQQQRLKVMRSLVKEATAAGVNAEFTQTLGDRGETICNLAQTWSADLIVVGSRGLTGIKEMFLGSVSNYVTHHAPCSVFIVLKTADTN
ncbi:universal stress protein [Pleurocapsa sp. CCALA 161]|uniref:universal stress protein n=1 Tax=Pleurocapsa sp. CCALA 161 TaxID=2107688 RepID=UPI001E525379|nr:universal stress protein [Pleurocapsa sp. CCALA 161]